jgi:DNA-binding transcriptional regulator YhcF (GntR family)
MSPASGSQRPLGREAVADALRDRIVNGLHVGRYTGGERLPSGRELAAEFGVNERVVLAALRALADEGFVVLRRRSGAYVARPHPAAGGALPDLGAWHIGMLLQARARGLPPREVSEYVRRSLETRRVHAACIECNHDQLHLLCSELADDHGFVTEPVEVDALRAPEPSLALRRADLLVTTLYHAPAVQALAERLGKAWIAVALRPEALEQVGHALHEGPVYYVATDPRFERKLRGMIAPVGPVENLRVMLVDRDDLDAIPADAPTFVMPSARMHLAARFGPRGGPGRQIQPARLFSDEAARELLSFLVRANMASLAAGLG